MRGVCGYRAILLLTGAIACVGGDVVFAQDASQGRGITSPGEIIVTARKREESLTSVPVTITAIGQEDLERRAISQIDSLTRAVPTLVMGTSGGAVQGGVIAIRGIAGSDVNPFADQAVSFNVDGVQIARALVRRMANMDMAQIEVLKGPQALFFGKNSPGGIISIRTADPGDHFEARTSVGYEFNARELRGDGFISGPLTDGLGARLAFYGTTMRGWMNNDFEGGGVFAPEDKHLPKTREYAVRGTLKFDRGSNFNARLKVNYSNLRDAGSLTTQERVDCPLGAPQLGGGPDDCRANGRTAKLDPGPFVAALNPDFREGAPFLRQKQFLASLEMNYHLSDEVVLTSVSGLYDTESKVGDNFGLAFNPDFTIANYNNLKFREFNQEVRLATDYGGIFDFVVGGLYQHSDSELANFTFLGAVQPNILNNYHLRQKGEAYSVFAQLMLRPVEVLELAVGGRYSHETKHLPLIASSLTLGEPSVIPFDPLIPRRDSWDDFSPEVTLAYKPSQRLTVFASYKQGFLSGGFNTGVNDFTGDLRYDQQTIDGFEGGIKAQLFDDSLQTSLSLYSYDVKGLQVTTNFQVGNQIIQRVRNAGKSSVEGVEFEFNYRPPVDGLSLRGAVAYNRAIYDDFTVNCFRGQTQGEGCNVGLPGPNGSYSLQDLAGERLVRAPTWTANAGIGYETTIGDALRGRFNVDVSYSSQYYTESAKSPDSYQDDFATIDANIELGSADEFWTLALIGRNLTDKYYFQRSVSAALTGSPPGGVTGFRGDTVAYVNRGREILLRATFKFGGR